LNSIAVHPYGYHYWVSIFKRIQEGGV
jgi:hypothetical protein